SVSLNVDRSGRARDLDERAEREREVEEEDVRRRRDPERGGARDVVAGVVETSRGVALMHDPDRTGVAEAVSAERARAEARELVDDERVLCTHRVAGLLCARLRGNERCREKNGNGEDGRSHGLSFA